MSTQLVYSEEFYNHNQPGHPENARRLNVMLNELQQAPFFQNLDLVEPTPISENTIQDIHSEEMIDLVKEFSIIGDAWIDPDTYVSKNDYHTARLAAGGLNKACQDILNNKTENAFALIRPPGHHATKTRSMGFCLFNNAALAAHELTKQGKKVLIFDNDVHHGNGTQDIFYHRSDVMYQSVHLSPHYPGTGAIDELGINNGEGYTINAPLHHGHGNTATTTILEEIFLPIATQFKPDFIIVSTGFDSHHNDLLGGLRYTTQFFNKMITYFQKIQPKIAITLEGGYNLEWIGRCLVAELAALTNHEITFDDSTDENTNIQSLEQELKATFASYWKV